MYQRHEPALVSASGTAALVAGQLVPDTVLSGAPPSGWRERLARGYAGLTARLADAELAPDLGHAIGSAHWWRGTATLAALIVAAAATYTGLQPLSYQVPAALDAGDFDELRAQTMIAPLAMGSDSGRSMAATDAVRPLAAAPERPRIELTATLGQGDSFTRVLERAGVSRADAAQIGARLGGVLPLSDIAPGTRIDLILGRRAVRTMPRPVEAISLRARLDLRVEMERIDGNLVLRRIPIVVDNTPLRVRGRVGSSLYRSARAAGAPASAVQDYLRVIGQQLAVNRDIGANDEFDIILDYRRAETGESETGKLLYAGMVRADGRQRLAMMPWTKDGRTQWFEASGVGQRRAGLARPTAGPITSQYGMRRHPILGYLRMHAGIDFGGGYGAPIYAVTDGMVSQAGRNGGYGNFVRINHGQGLASGYGHMSRIAVAAGQRVARGQLIGYIGSTGLSTGPHLHYELYRNGRTINPNSVAFVTRALLEGAELESFRARLRQLTAVQPGAALAPLAPTAPPPPRLGSLADTAAKRAGGAL